MFDQNFLPETRLPRSVVSPVIAWLEPAGFTHIPASGSSSQALKIGLQNAIRNREFMPYYQPIVHLTTGKVVGVEVLLRWQHPTWGLLSPIEFAPLLEQAKFQIDLDRWVLKTACQHLSNWQQQGRVDGSFFISVNFSAAQFAQPDLVPCVQTVLTSTNLSPQCLKLEITETTMMQNATSVVENMIALHDLQIQISIDDFGTGYSSLSYLYQFPIDCLKLDRSFLDDLHQVPMKLRLVSGIVQLAQTLKLPLIAEGIETSGQLAQLKLLGCEFGQGYWFAEPLPECSMTQYLTAL